MLGHTEAVQVHDRSGWLTKQGQMWSLVLSSHYSASLCSCAYGYPCAYAELCMLLATR